MTRLLGALAFVLALGAAFAKDPRPRAAGALDVAEIGRLISTERDHVTAVELATRIRDQKPRLRIVDVRPESDFHAFRIPNAENVPIERLSTTKFNGRETVVLYSDGGAHAAQAWVLLRARGLSEVYFLRGGLAEWMQEVLSPVLPEDATPEEKAAFAPRRELSHYFGGNPTIGPRVAPPASLSERVASMKRRGC